MSATPIVDAGERCEALDPTRSFCVQAPAGSGKTELLTQRVLRLLAGCERPEEILAITFTRKAAAEMRKRLVDSLNKARAMSAESIAALAPHERLTCELAVAALAQDARQGWNLLSDTARLRITTIDSFNSYLCGRLPIVSGFGSQPEINEDAAPFYREAVDELLSGLEDGGPAAEPLAVLLGHLDNNVPALQALLCGLLANRDQWLAPIMAIRDPAAARPALERNLAALVGEILAQARGLCAEFGPRLMPLLRYAADKLAEAGNESLRDLGFGNRLPAAEVESLAQWKALCAFLLTQKDEPRRSATVRDGFPPASKAVGAEAKRQCEEMKTGFLALCADLAERRDILETLVQVRRLPSPSYPDGQWRVLEALTRLLPLLVARLEVVLRRHGQTDYVQVSGAALAALGEEERPTDLALRLDYRIRHILVDEFQDTSHLQNELLARLCHGWQPGDGRTLFIVGDGMQSCYGFRNANVGLFLKARDQGIGQVRLQPLQLKVNFRSQEAVVNWVNEVFGGAFPAIDDIGRGAVRYSPSEALRREHAEAGVETLIFSCDKEAELPPAAAHRTEAREVARLVEWLQREDSEASIAILVRYRSHLQSIIPALREAGIAWNASDIDPLSSYPEIRDLLVLCRALLNLADFSAWLALLRAPFVGLALPDIHRIARHQRERQCSMWSALRAGAALAGLSSDARDRLARALPVLERARGERGRRPLRDWLETAWIGLGGPATLERDGILPSIASFFRLLEKHERHGDLVDIHDFEAKVARVYASAELDGAARLQIMTIHKSKGLEFDHVILPGLGRLSNRDDNPLIRWKDHVSESGERLLISAPGRKGEGQDEVYDYLKYEADLKNGMEDTRLLYIGVTRAARRAWLMGHMKSENGVLKPPPKRSLLATVWPRLEALDGRIPLSVIPVEEAPPVSTEEDGGFRTRRIVSGWRHPFAERPRDEDAAQPGWQADPAHRNALERQVGEIIHHCLKLAVLERRDPADPRAFSTLEEVWRLQLRPWTADPHGAIAVVRHHLLQCSRHPNAAWLLDGGHGESACELALSDYAGSLPREYVIDRTFVDEDGVRWIIDYKSASPRGGQPLESFLEEQQAAYLPQLERYAGLFRSMEDRPQRAALFFTALPHFHEVDLALSPELNA